MKEVIIIILFILDKKLEVKDVLSIDGDIGYSTPFFDDEYKQYLDTGAETYKFSTLANTQQSQHLVVGNYIAFLYKGQHKLFQIINIDEEHSETFIKNAYCEMAGIELINNIVRPMEIKNADIKKFAQTILADTEWQIGLLDVGVNTVQDIKITEYTNVYSALQQYAVQEYGAEISLTVKIENNKVVAKHVNIYRERGKKNGFRFAYESNVSSITRTVDSSNLATALIGVGKNNITFKEVDAPDKPLNQDFIADEQSYKRWNQNGRHIMGLFKCESESPHELLKLTRKELEKRRTPNVKYQLKTELLGRDEVCIGDTVNVVDYEFNPPIFLEARVNELSISFTDSEKNECVLANFKEVGTKITDQLRGLINSKFPIHSEDIADGAVGKDQVSIQYHTQLIADAVHASLIETEDLIASKADIEELNAVKARIGTLDVGVVIAEELKAIKGNITTLDSDKANVKDLDAIKGSVIHLKTEKIDTNEFNAKVANIDTTITNNFNATNAEIELLKSRFAKIGTLVAENATITNGKITNLETDIANINKTIVDIAEIKDLSAITAKIKTLETDLTKANTAIIENAKITNSEIETLKGNYAQINTLISKKADIDELNSANAKIKKLDATVADVNKAIIKNAEITKADIEKLKSKDAEIDNALIDKANISDLTAINASIQSLQAKDASIDKALINKASVNSLNVINATVESMGVKVAEIDKLKAKDAEFDTLLAGNLTAKNFKAGSITAESAIIAEEAVGSSQISSLTANKIDSGEIDTAKVKVKSTNGEIEISGYQILVNDTTDLKNKVNRVVLGEYIKADKTKEYGLLIRGKDGKTVMMDSDGVHNAGITDGAINNNKIADDANINAKKIDIESVVTHINNASTKIEGSSIVMDNKSLNVAIKEIENTQTSQSQDLKQAKTDIQASIEKINLSVSKVNTTINEQGTKIEKNSSAISLQQDQINLKVDANGVINAINVDASGVAINGEKINLNGCVTFNSLNSSTNEFGGLFDKEFNKTVVNGQRIMTNSIKAQQIDIYGLSVKQKQANGMEIETLKIEDDGSIRLKGDIESFDYNEKENTGWKLSKEGDAVLNNTKIRGSVVLPNAGITNHSAGYVNNIFLNSDYSDIYNYDGYEWDKNLNGTIGAKYWGDYNSGVSNPKTGYHAHTNTTAFDFNVVEFKAVNNERWLGSKQNITESVHQFKKDTTYYFSMDVFFTEVGQQVDGGLFYKIDEKNDFHSGKFCFVAKQEHLNKWVRFNWSFKLKEGAQLNRDFTWYNYGYNGKPSQKSFYIKNCLLTTTNTNVWCVNDSERNDIVRFWAGADYKNRNNAPFKVMQNGDVYAKNGIYKGTFTGRIEIGNILIEDTKGTKGKITFESETGANVLDVEEDEVKIGVNTTIGTESSNISITKTDATITNKDVSIVRTENGKSHTVVQIDADSKEFLHLNGTHKLVSNGSTLIVDGNQTEFTNNITVRNSITTNDMVVGNMQMKRRNDSGNKGIDFIFV